MNQSEYIAKCARDLNVSEDEVWRRVDTEGRKRTSHFPCGCVVDLVEADQRSFVIQPCSLACHIYEASVQCGNEAGIPIVTITDPVVSA